MISESDSDCEPDVPTELVEAAKNISLNLLPEKSKRQYTAVYNEFKRWRTTKKTTSFAEEIFLVYFDELSRKMKPSTLWARYSMLKATLKTYNNIDLSTYKKLVALLKRKSSGYKAKKSKIFTAANVSQFCNEAPNAKFLGTKVNIICK